MWINISKWFQSIKTSVSHMMLAEVDNRFCFAAISYLSLATPITAQWLLNKMAMVEGIKGTHGHSNIGVYSPRLSWPRPLLSTLSASSRGQHRACNVAPLSRGPASYSGAGWWCWSSSITEGAAFVLAGIGSYSDYRFASSAAVLLPNPPFVSGMSYLLS